MNKGAIVGGFDLVYDCVGEAATINNSLRWVKAGGKVVMVGASLAPMKNVDLVTLWYSQLEFVGVVAHGHEHHDGRHKHTYEWVFDFLRDGKIRTEGLITHRFPFDEYKHALKFAAGHKGKPKAIKVIMQERPAS